MKPEWWTNGKACSRIPRVVEIWREQGCEVTPLYSEAALLDAHQRGRREGMEEAASVARCAFDDRPRRDSMDWNDGFDDGTKAAEYAIQAKAQEVKT